MKHIIFLFLSSTIFYSSSTAQTVTWYPAEQSSPNIISLDFHLDYGSIIGVSYGRKIDGTLPFVLGAEISVPFGSDIIDDWRVQANAQALLWQQNHWAASAKAGISQLRFRSEIAQISQIGSDLGLTIGYEHQHWGLATVVSWRKSWMANIQHQDLQAQYPDIYNGWIGQTGSNLRFDIRGNVILNSWMLFLSVGKIYGQNFQDNPTFPFATSLVLAKRF